VTTLGQNLFSAAPSQISEGIKNMIFPSLFPHNDLASDHFPCKYLTNRNIIILKEIDVS